MNLQKLYLDKDFMSSLSSLAIKEGLINRSLWGEHWSKYHDLKKRVNNKSKLLMYLTLFDEIDGFFEPLDYKEIINTGLFDAKANINSEYIPKKALELQYGNQEYFKSSTETKNLVRNLRDSTNTILLKNQKKLSENILKTFLIRKKLKFVDDFMSLSGPSLHFAKIKTPSITKSEKIINSIINGDVVNEFQTQFFDYAYFVIEDIREGFLQGIYFSIEEKSSFASTLLVNQSPLPDYNPIKVIDNLDYVVKTNLNSEISYLPNPNSLKDVFKIRERKELIRFREVLQFWLAAVQDGDSNLEIYMRKDLEKANKELRKLEKWKEYKYSTLNFWINSIGGHIPVLSNILTVVTTLGGFYEYKADKRHKWVTLIQ